MIALLFLPALLFAAAPPFQLPTLPELRQSLAKAASPIETFGALEKLAKFYASAPLGTEDRREARATAQRLLKESAGFPRNWNYPNAIHHANLVLGRIRLAEGDTTGAKAYLRKAGSVGGSPQLESYGPNLTLAGELLAKGEGAAVLDYLARCRKFWKLGAEKTSTWTADIKAGRRPDFGASLRY